MAEIFGECANCGSDVEEEDYNRTGTLDWCESCGQPCECENCGAELMSVAEEMSGICNECEGEEQ